MFAQPSIKSYVVKCHFHDDATPLSFRLQVTEDFIKIL